MCGLSGYFHTRKQDLVPAQVSDIFFHLYVLSQLRGTDASGVAGLWKWLPKGNKKIIPRHGWITAKNITSPAHTWKFLQHYIDKKYLDADRKTKDKYQMPDIAAVIAHARAATKGNVTVDNAHPFSFGNNRFIGVHNGTIDNAPEVYNKLKNKEPLPNTTPPDKEYGDKATDVTDSEIVLYCIYRWGIEEVYPLIRGAWAFVWYSQSDGTISIIRNHARPLYYFFSTRNDAVFWSSERSMIQYALGRVQSSVSEFGADTCKEFTAHWLYKYTLDQQKYIAKADKDFDWSSRTFLDNYKNSNNHSSYGYYNMFGNNDDDYYTTPKTTDSENTNTGTKNNVIGLAWSFRQGKLVSKEEYEEEIKLYGEHKHEGEDSVDCSRDCTNDDSMNCLYCGHHVSPNDMDAMDVKRIGVVCSGCVDDYDAVLFVVESFDEAADDPQWVRKFTELDDLRKVSNGPAIH